MLATIESIINGINESIGRFVSWFVIAMVVITFLNVLMRYGFNFGLIAVQELVVYLHAFVFMIAIAYTYKQDAHVRVDIFYENFSAKRKAWVNLLGSLILLLPFCTYLIYASWDYAYNSWQLLEGSREAGGLPLVFLLKTLVPLMPALLMLQGISTICHSMITLKSDSA
jgi:TRAP-type mannitol/chloroaromatic compound transport system permease small subunit